MKTITGTPGLIRLLMRVSALAGFNVAQNTNRSMLVEDCDFESLEEVARLCRAMLNEVVRGDG